MVEIIGYSMSQKAVEGDDEMTELEKEVVMHRVQEMNDTEKCSVEEFLDNF